MKEKVDLASLKGIAILYEDDLHDLGQFVLKAYDAQWAGTRSKSRPTLHGLARIYGLILNCSSRPFEEAIEACGLPLDATVDDGHRATLNVDSGSDAPRRFEAIMSAARG